MIIHVVQQGDTIDSVSSKYGASSQRVISDNGLYEPFQLVVGESLVIQIPTVVHTVKSGDTLESIAGQYGVTTMTLLQNNPIIITRDNLFTGETIVISFEGEKLGNIVTNGYAYPFIDINILKTALVYMNSLTIFGYGFTETGELIPIEDEPLIKLAYEYHTKPIMLISSLTETGVFSNERASLAFQNKDIQNTLISNIIANMKEKGYLGLDIDFEFIAPENRDAYLSFIKNTTTQLNDAGFTVNVDLAPKTSSEQAGLLYEAHDYKAIGAVANTVFVMTYEWGYTYGPPMAVAPLNNVKTVLDYAVTQIDKNKILMGIPNYGYDWPLPFVRGTTKAESIGNQDAVQIAKIQGVPIRFDDISKAPNFSYYDNNGIEHIVWFEDARSIDAKLDLLHSYPLLGCGYWNLMKPFMQNWVVLNAKFNIVKSI